MSAQQARVRHQGEPGAESWPRLVRLPQSTVPTWLLTLPTRDAYVAIRLGAADLHALARQASAQLRLWHAEVE